MDMDARGKNSTRTRRGVLLVMPANRRRPILQSCKTLGIEASLAANCREARSVLGNGDPTPVVVTDVTLDDGNWSDLLRFVVDNDVPTNVVVAAPDADEHLWSEAVWRGAYDVLVEPHEQVEVERVLDSAMRSSLGLAVSPAH